MRFDHVADSQKLKEAHLGMTGAATLLFWDCLVEAKSGTILLLQSNTYEKNSIWPF